MKKLFALCQNFLKLSVQILISHCDVMIFTILIAKMWLGNDRSFGFYGKRFWKVQKHEIVHCSFTKNLHSQQGVLRSIIEFSYPISTPDEIYVALIQYHNIDFMSRIFMRAEHRKEETDKAQLIISSSFRVYYVNLALVE